jgi:predicted permease
LLVAAEVALATVLVAGAVLAVRSYGAIAGVDPGFRAEGVVAASYHLPSARYPEPADVTAFHRRVLARAGALPGVRHAALANSLPLEGTQWTSSVLVEGRPESADTGGETPEFSRRIVSPSYFATVGVRLLAGRGLAPGAGEATPAEVVVNATLARRHFPAGNALGQRVDWDAGGERVWRTVVGVVADERVEGLAAPAPAEILLPLGQELLDGTGYAQRSVTLALRTTGRDPTALLPELRAALAALDPELPLYAPRTLDEMLAEDTRRERLVAVLLGLFAAVALVLALLGLYGLVAFTVSERRREIGIRLTLGASPRGTVARLTLGVLGFVGAGLAAGLAGAAAAGRTLGGFLHGVDPADPATLLATGGLLLAAAALAAALPARAATRADPLETLRAE